MKTKTQAQHAPLAVAKLEWQVKRQGELRYLAYLPKDYPGPKSQRWPLMLFLHGMGERGTDVQRAGLHGPLKQVKSGQDFPFLIIAPQCPEDQIWEPAALLQLLDQLEQKYQVDPKRIYLTGLSMGGYGTWQLGLAHPERFAALVPICGGGNIIEVVLGPRAQVAQIKHLPIWAFHGAKDDIVPPIESERLVAQLKKLGAKKVKLTLYPEADHDSWTETYQSAELYEWLLKQSR